MSTSPPSTPSPSLLQGGSVLALADIRGRIRPHCGPSLSRSRLLSLLAVDPPAMLRAVRAANAPVLAREPDALSAPDLLRRLGPHALKRILAVPALPPGESAVLRATWLHAVATACAARELARACGLDTQRAYACGLLHETRTWGAWCPSGCGHEACGMRLPGELLECTLAWERSGDAAPAAGTMASVVVAARALAWLAGFPHPLEDREQALPPAPHASPSRQGPTAESVGKDLEAALEAAGLHPHCVLEPDRAGAGAAQGPLFDGPAPRPEAQALALLLRRGGRAGVAEVKQAAAAAGLEVGFDRGFFLRWPGGRAVAEVVHRSDFTPHQPAAAGSATVTPAPTEASLLLACQDGTPRLLRRTGRDASALLDLLGCDEVLVAAVSTDKRRLGYLLLDRSYRTLPVDGAGDAASASALARVAGLVLENLSLRAEVVRTSKMAQRDSLTRLLNRRVGLELLERELMRARRVATHLSLIMVDVDAFKKINDRLGHLTGDVVLRSIADVLRRNFRTTDIVCRYGGEEFLVVQPDTPLEKAATSAARLHKAVEAVGDELGVSVTVSVGVTSVNTLEDDAGRALQRADQALYASKGRGRNRFSVDEG